MITKYSEFLITEKISISNDDIVEILKSLETEDNRNDKLIKRLVNHTDNKGKTVLMNIVQSNNEDLIDYILKFDVDLNCVTKDTGENVLYYCKNIRIFKKLYDLGADVKHITKIGRNILINLASKKLYDVDIYQRLINDGVDINKYDVNGSSVLNESITNKKILSLLIKNGINLNDDITQVKTINYLMYDIHYLKNKRRSSLNILKMLFESGMKIIRVENFTTQLIEICTYESYQFSLYHDFIVVFKKYITDEMLIKIIPKVIGISHISGNNVTFIVNILNLGSFPDFYDYMREKYFGIVKFDEMFSDFNEKNPHYADMKKYNL